MGLSGLASVLNKICQICCSVVMLPLGISVLGLSDYGALLAALSIIVLLPYFDFGLGHATQNLLTSLSSKPGNSTVFELVFVSFLSILSISIFGILLLETAWWLKTNLIFNVFNKAGIPDIDYPSLRALIYMVFLSWPFTVFGRLLAAHQKIYVNELISSCIYVCSAAVLFFCSDLDIEFNIVLAIFSMPVFLPNFFAFAYVLVNRKLFDIMWELKNFGALGLLLARGIRFFLIQVFSVLGNNLDTLLVFKFFGAVDSGSYATLKKLFTFAGITQYFIAPLWPAFGDAIAKKEVSWVRKTFFAAFLFSNLLTIVIALFMFLFAQAIITLWVGNSIKIDQSLLICFCFWLFLQNNGGLFSAVLNNGDLVNKQTIFVVFSGLASFLLQAFAAQGFGPYFMVLSMMVSYLCFYFVPTAFLLTCEFKEER